MKKDLYKLELLKSPIKQRKPNFVGFFFQYAKLRILELFYNFYRYSDENKLEELEMDTDCLYLALAE